MKVIGLAVGLLLLAIPLFSAGPVLADNPPTWVHFTNVCYLQYDKANGNQVTFNSGPIEFDARYNNDRGAWDLLRLPGERKRTHITAFRALPCVV